MSYGQSSPFNVSRDFGGGWEPVLRKLECQRHPEEQAAGKLLEDHDACDTGGVR